MTGEGERHWWQRNKEPLTEQDRSEARIRVHARYLRKLRRRRVWRRRAQSIDPQKWPLPLLRWLAVLGLAIAWWASGAKTSPPQDWVPYAVVAGALILPDIAGFAIGGFRLDLQQAQDEIATLRQEVNAQARAEARAGAVIAMGDKALEAASGLNMMGEIVNAGRPGAAAEARPLSTIGSAMDASHEKRVP